MSSIPLRTQASDDGERLRYAERAASHGDSDRSGDGGIVAPSGVRRSATTGDVEDEAEAKGGNR